MGGGGGGGGAGRRRAPGSTPNSRLYGEAPPKRVPFSAWSIQKGRETERKLTLGY